MAEIQHKFVEQTTEQTHTGDSNWTDIPGAAIADADLIDGKKYLLVVTGQLNITSIGVNAGMRLLHGSTVFAESVINLEPANDQSRYCYTWFTVWTAVVGEGVKLQFQTNNIATTVKANFLTLFAMNLTDDLTENTDWKYVSDASGPTALTAAFVVRASLPIIPGSGGDDWLVLTTSRHTEVTANSDSLTVRLARSGEAASTLPQFMQEGEDTARDNMILTPFRVFNLGAVSNTFAVESKSNAPSGNYQSSQVFILNLNKFDRHENAYTEVAVELSTTDYGSLDLATVSITPSVAGDVWAMASFNFDANRSGAFCKGRLQVDNADQPPAQTSNAYKLEDTADATDELPVQLQTVENLSVAAHNIDLDGSSESVPGTQEAQERVMMAVAMELAGAPPPGPPAGLRTLALTGVGI